MYLKHKLISCLLGAISIWWRIICTLFTNLYWLRTVRSSYCTTIQQSLNCKKKLSDNQRNKFNTTKPKVQLWGSTIQFSRYECYCRDKSPICHARRTSLCRSLDCTGSPSSPSCRRWRIVVCTAQLTATCPLNWLVSWTFLLVGGFVQLPPVALLTRFVTVRAQVFKVTVTEWTYRRVGDVTASQSLTAFRCRWGWLCSVTWNNVSDRPMMTTIVTKGTRLQFRSCSLEFTARLFSRNCRLYKSKSQLQSVLLIKFIQSSFHIVSPYFMRHWKRMAWAAH